MSDYTYEIRSRGGIGKAAIWDWSVYRENTLDPVSSGEVKGAESKATSAAKAEIERLRMQDKIAKKKPKRPRDPNQLAKLMVDIASGEEQDDQPTDAQKRAAKGGEKGGRARAKALTPKERSEIASIAAQARWKSQGSMGWLLRLTIPIKVCRSAWTTAAMFRFLASWLSPLNCTFPGNMGCRAV